jgi:hypothetical protein
MITFSNSNIQPRAAEKQKMKQSGPRAINRHPLGLEFSETNAAQVDYQTRVTSCQLQTAEISSHRLRNYA